MSLPELDGEDATVASAVWTHVETSHANRCRCATSQRVLTRLVAILARDDKPLVDEEIPVTEPPQVSLKSIAKDRALAALVVITRGSRESSGNVAAALTRNAIAWLVDQDDQMLLPALTEQSDAFAARLARARGVPYYRVRIERACDAENTKMIKRAVAALCLVAQCTTDPRQTKEAVDTLAALTHHGPRTVMDAVASLVDMPAARQVLLMSTERLVDHIRTLQESRHDGLPIGRQRCAMLCLATRVSEANRDTVATIARIIDGHGTAALLDALEIELRLYRQSEAKQWSSAAQHLLDSVVNALGQLAARAPLVCLQIKDTGGLATLINVACTDAQAARDAVRLLEKYFLPDTATREIVSVTGGVRVLVAHLRHGSSDMLKRSSAETLRQLLASDATVRTEFVERFGEYTQFLSTSGQVRVAYQQTSTQTNGPDERLKRLLMQGDENALTMLESMMRDRQKQASLAAQDGAVTKLAKLFTSRSSPAIQVGAARVLAHLAAVDTGKRQLLDHTSAFIRLLSSPIDELAIAATTVLLRLADDPIGQSVVAAAIPRSLGIVASRQKSTPLRELSVRFLAELVRGRYTENGSSIIAADGIRVVLGLLRDASATWKLCYYGCTILWRITKRDHELQRRLRDVGAAGILENLIRQNELHPIDAAERLLAILDT